VDLRGYDPEQPLDPHEALGILLRSLGLADAELPGRLTARISRYRTLADGKRMLIVLDNAFSADQVRPLLPGAPGCFVVVTSRDDLAGLVARDGAHRITLGPLTEAEGTELLEALLGPRRVLAEPQAARTLADACERLPLAMRLAAEAAFSRPDEPLAAIAAELRERRLALLAGSGDERADLRAVLSWSYRRLVTGHPAAARAFRLLGIHPGPDFDAPSAAALLGVPSGHAADLIGVLARGHLVEPRPGMPRRFRMHDLLRAYAAELSAACDDGQATEASLTQLARYCTLAAERAARLLAPEADGAPPAAGPGDADLPGFTGAGPARCWLDAQRPGLVAVAVAAADRGLGGYAGRLSAALEAYLDSAARYHDALTVHACALRVGDAADRAAARARLAATYLRLGRIEEALMHAGQALADAQAAGDRPALVSARQWLGVAQARLGQNEAAAGHFLSALALARRAGDRLTEGRLTGYLAIVHAQQRHYGQALEHGLRALALARELGDQPGEGRALCNLGDICRLAGHYRDAAAYGQQAEVIAAETGDRSAQADIAVNLAVTCMNLGRYTEAEHYYRQAMAGARDVGHRDLETRARTGLQEAAGRRRGGLYGPVSC
jgi:tetratricopeptide (TPR) repeat protein